MKPDALSDEFEHERLNLFHDRETGAIGAIAIHSTALGPAMGGLRLFAYPRLTDALVDVLRLARAMSLKCAAAGLDLGGGKAVLLDDGAWSDRREARMLACGRAVEELGGRYVTAEDVGTTPADMDTLATVTDYVAGRSVERGGRGDPSPYTARTVFGAVGSAIRVRLGCEDLAGIRVGVQGVGSVGARLVALLREAGARVWLTDADPKRAAAVATEHGATALPLENFLAGGYDVLAPCAMGGAIGPREADRLVAPIVAGAANNPLAARGLARTLMERDILYVPDFLANCGGVIHVGAEALGLGDQRVEDLVEAAVKRTERLLVEAQDEAAVPLEVAEAFAEERLRAGRGTVA